MGRKTKVRMEKLYVPPLDSWKVGDLIVFTSQEIQKITSIWEKCPPGNPEFLEGYKIYLGQIIDIERINLLGTPGLNLKTKSIVCRWDEIMYFGVIEGQIPAIQKLSVKQLCL